MFGPAEAALFAAAATLAARQATREARPLSLKLWAEICEAKTHGGVDGRPFDYLCVVPSQFDQLRREMRLEWLQLQELQRVATGRWDLRLYGLPVVECGSPEDYERWHAGEYPLVIVPN